MLAWRTIWSILNPRSIFLVPLEILECSLIASCSALSVLRVIPFLVRCWASSVFIGNSGVDFSSDSVDCASGYSDLCQAFELITEAPFLICGAKDARPDNTVLGTPTISIVTFSVVMKGNSMTLPLWKIALSTSQLPVGRLLLQLAGCCQHRLTYHVWQWFWWECNGLDDHITLAAHS